MPSVTQEQPLVPSKKRRRDDQYAIGVPKPLHEPTRVQTRTILSTDVPVFSTHLLCRDDACYTGANHSHEANYPPTGHTQPREIAPLPASKRPRIFDEEKTRSPPSRSTSPTASRQSKPPPTSPPGRGELRETSANSRPSPTRANSGLLLSRCHICHRKPTRKSDLDSFADCQGCGQRTCFVCLRQCLDWRPDSGDEMLCNGPTQDLSASFHMEDADAETEGREGVASESGSHQNLDKEQQRQADGWAKGGHRQVVCSRCCVERGPDGDVVCLGCLPFVEG